MMKRWGNLGGVGQAFSPMPLTFSRTGKSLKSNQHSQEWLCHVAPAFLPVLILKLVGICCFKRKLLKLFQNLQSKRHWAFSLPDFFRSQSVLRAFLNRIWGMSHWFSRGPDEIVRQSQLGTSGCGVDLVSPAVRVPGEDLGKPRDLMKSCGNLTLR